MGETSRFTRGSDPRVATCRGKLQTRRSKLNQEINRELRLRAGAENLFRATTNRKMKETVALELSFVNSNLQLLKEQLAELNSSVEIYQSESSEPVMPMIPLGLKETKEIDFREPFKDFILEHYSEDASQYDEVITQFMELRQAMRTPQRDSSGVALLFQYYNQLYFVERRFFPPDRSLGIYFEWYDSLTGVPSCQRTVAFEKACVLFNLSGLYTQMAARQERSMPRGLDNAVDGFLRAAGALTYLLDNFTNAPTMDLSPPVLELLAHLMLAQARECLLEKLVLQSEERRTPEMYLTLAEESTKVSETYREAEKLSAPLREYLPYSWPSLCAVKREFYSALSSRKTAQAFLTASETVPSLQKLLLYHQETTRNVREEYALMGCAHLKAALAHHEEAARIQRMCRELRDKRSLYQVLARTSRETLERFRSQEARIQNMADLIDPPPITGRSQLVLKLTVPDFGQERVDDLFRDLGPLAVFSAKLHWSAPRTVRLQQSGTDASSLGFTVSTDCPVVVTSVQSDSLAQVGGIKEGDFIVAIGDRDVKWSSHEEAVRLMKESASRLTLKLVTPVHKAYPAKSCAANSSSAAQDPASNAPTSHKKLSWNPFKRHREAREAALSIVSR